MAVARGKGVWSSNPSPRLHRTLLRRRFQLPTKTAGRELPNRPRPCRPLAGLHNRQPGLLSRRTKERWHQLKEAKLKSGHLQKGRPWKLPQEKKRLEARGMVGKGWTKTVKKTRRSRLLCRCQLHRTHRPVVHKGTVARTSPHV